MGKQWKQCQTLFFWAPKSLQMVIAAMKLKEAYSLERNLWLNLDIKKQRHYFANKGPSSQGYGFSNGHAWMWGLDCWRKLNAEELMLLNYSAGEDSWESLGLQGDPISPSSRRSILSIHLKDWCWNWNSSTLTTWFIWKDPNARKDWRWEEKGTTEDEIVGWHHWFNGHESE